MTFDEWLTYGLEYAFCGKPTCWTHEPELTAEEEEAFESGDDPCVPVFRVFPPAIMSA